MIDRDTYSLIIGILFLIVFLVGMITGIAAKAILA